MNENKDIRFQLEFLKESEAEKKRIRQLQRLAPKITAENLVKINDKTWILKKNGETKQQARERFLAKMKNNLYFKGFHNNFSNI